MSLFSAFLSLLSVAAKPRLVSVVGLEGEFPAPLAFAGGL